MQRELLSRMQKVYPDTLTQIDDIDLPTLVSQLSYLEGHGLCDAGLMPNMVGYSWIGCRITVAGLDFLADDGGLTAILGVVTIKLHADTVRDLLAAKVDSSELPPAKKSAIKSALQKLSGTALQAATGDLVKMGFGARAKCNALDRAAGIGTVAKLRLPRRSYLDLFPLAGLFPIWYNIKHIILCCLNGLLVLSSIYESFFIFLYVESSNGCIIYFDLDLSSNPSVVPFVTHTTRTVSYTTSGPTTAEF